MLTGKTPGQTGRQSALSATKRTKIMKKTAIAFMLAIALAAAIVIVRQQTDHLKPGEKPAPVTETNKSLAHIPADTALFFGGIQPVAMKSMVQNTQASFNNSAQVETIRQSLQQQADASPAWRFASHLWLDYATALQTPDSFFSGYGIADSGNFSLYTLGAIPVLRITLADAKAFADRMMDIEAQAGTTGQPKTLGTAWYRAYETDPGNPVAPQLVIGSDGADAVITFAIQDNIDHYLDTAFGQQAPTQSLQSSPALASLAGQYGFDPRMLGFINHQAIIAGLTQAEGSTLGKMLTLFANHEPDFATSLATLRSPACQADFADIGQNWPRTVFGYTRLKMVGLPMYMDSLSVIESRNVAMLASLKQLRGFIPAHINQADTHSLANIGIGADVDQLVPAINGLIAELTQPTYQCQYLQQAQQTLSTTNTLPVGMVAGMAAGTKGLSLSLLELVMEMNPQTEQPSVKQVDALLTVSATNPRALLQNLMAMFPQLQGITIPSDGSAIDLPLPVPQGLQVQPKVAIKGNHLVAYVGPKSAHLAEGMAATEVTANGFMQFGMDYGRYFQILADIISASGKPIPPEAAQVFDSFKDSDMQFTSALDFDERGILMRGDITINKLPMAKTTAATH
jgi:hypothetical protein